MNLSFKTILLEGNYSIASLPLVPRCGIYIYTFSDGSIYVGKSKKVAKRHAQHLCDYRHDPKMKELEILKLEFAEVKDDNDDLDDAETRVISYCESQGMRMRNILKMNVPYSAEPNYHLSFSNETSVYLPLERAHLTQSLSLVPKESVSESQHKRYERFIEQKDSMALLELLGAYLSETVPEFRASAGKLWSCTLYPHTKEAPRKMTVSCGNIETFVIFDTEEIFRAFVNLKEPQAEHGLIKHSILMFGHKYAWLRKLGCKLSWGNYHASPTVIQAHFNSLENLASALKDSRFLDWCYCLNVEMLRKCGSTMYARFNNPLIIQALGKYLP